MATREDLREYLLYLVDAGLSSATVSNHLSAIRTVFDKLCGRQITLGMVTPRRPKRLPVILSPEEVRSLLEAATSLRDKLILGLMYATGMRVRKKGVGYQLCIAPFGPFRQLVPDPFFPGATSTLIGE